MKQGLIMRLLRAYLRFPLSRELEPKNVHIVKTYVIMEQYIGWGLHFVQRGEYIQLVSLTPGSYAQRNGILQPGDVLFKVGKAKLLGFRLLHISSMVNAIKTGTAIRVTVYRNFIPLLGQCTTNTTAAVAAPDAGHATRATTCSRCRASHYPLGKVSPRKLSMQTTGPSAHSKVVLHGDTCADHNKKEQFKKDLQEEQQPHQQKQKNKEHATMTAVSTTTNVTAAAPANGLTTRASTSPQARESHNSLMKMSPGKDLQEQQQPHQLQQKKTIQLEFMRVGYERTVEIVIPESRVGSTQGTCKGQEVEKEAIMVQSRKKEVLSDKEDATTTTVSTATTTTNVTAAARDNDPAIRACTCQQPREFHDSLIKSK
ncbi:uncharacterized protein LOC116954035 isoform X1 [Petromyzon marinus]|uniref:uncharacterized protein LOC116954035 isoform X1 n=1 Tax=Petromyzon marinus TaxID=7757 RepID=UPI003F6F5B49